MTAAQAETLARLVEAAEHGDGDAACRLGDMYREGLGGLRYSPKETYRWYARSAMAGDANGQSNLGACYEHGLGCAQSYAKAAKWYRLSAAQGLGTAAMNLGYHYLRGHGVRATRSRRCGCFGRPSSAARTGRRWKSNDLKRRLAYEGFSLPPRTRRKYVRVASLPAPCLQTVLGEQLQPSQTAQPAVVTNAPHVITPGDEETTEPQSSTGGYGLGSGSWTRRRVEGTSGWLG